MFLLCLLILLLVKLGKAIAGAAIKTALKITDVSTPAIDVPVMLLEDDTFSLRIEGKQLSSILILWCSRRVCC